MTKMMLSVVILMIIKLTIDCYSHQYWFSGNGAWTHCTATASTTITSIGISSIAALTIVQLVTKYYSHRCWLSDNGVREYSIDTASAAIIMIWIRIYQMPRLSWSSDWSQTIDFWINVTPEHCAQTPRRQRAPRPVGRMPRPSWWLLGWGIYRQGQNGCMWWLHWN